MKINSNDFCVPARKKVNLSKWPTRVKPVYKSKKDLRPLITVAYWTGWRRSELLRLEWRQVNLATGEASLDLGTTKNKSGRVIFLPPEVLETLRDWRQYTLTLERAQQRLISCVFHMNGRPIKTFYRSWRTATKIAKVPDQLFHDLRRSSVRNYVRSGVPERVVMAISGHKTRSIFDRYNIVSAQGTCKPQHHASQS